MPCCPITNNSNILSAEIFISAEIRVIDSQSDLRILLHIAMIKLGKFWCFG